MKVEMMIRRISGVFCLLAALGCGAAAPERPGTVPVTGTVMYRGKPVDGAVVSLLAEKVPQAATGTTDSTGRFQLSTFGDKDGAVPGSHRATVVKLIPELQQQPGEDANAYTSRVLGKDPGKSSLPAKYASVRTTTLTAQIKADGSNDIQLDLVD